MSNSSNRFFSPQSTQAPQAPQAPQQAMQDSQYQDLSDYLNPAFGLATGMIGAAALPLSLVGSLIDQPQVQHTQISSNLSFVDPKADRERHELSKLGLPSATVMAAMGGSGFGAINKSSQNKPAPIGSGSSAAPKVDMPDEEHDLIPYTPSPEKVRQQSMADIEQQIAALKQQQNELLKSKEGAYNFVRNEVVPVRPMNQMGPWQNEQLNGLIGKGNPYSDYNIANSILTKDPTMTKEALLSLLGKIPK